jgi:diguanylate cyclase (GGDEF)-like protein
MDIILRASVSDEDTITFISMIKGWIYVILSAIIIFLLIAQSLRKIRIAQEELEIQNIELKAYQEKLQYNAYHDSLTGLPNRLSLYESLSTYMTDYPDRKVALLFIDADNFKFINDTMGHEFGNQLIINMGNNLSKLSDSPHTVYRIGGDEFICCCYGFNKIQEIEEYAEKIMQNLKMPFEINENTLHITVSIGISTYPLNGSTVASLMQCADIAMYRAKELGKNKYVFYNYTMQGFVTRRMIIEKHLRSAIHNDEFQVYYQPQIDIESHRITGFEALIRWNNPELGFVSPLDFIGISEETHLIIPIGEWVLRNACILIKQLLEKGYTELTISVNVSIVQLLQKEFVGMVQQVLASMDIAPKHLELEITESIMMESFDTIGNKLNQLKGIGVKIALDDFGKGYSSLSYLKQLPIDTLKIDKTFIDDIIDEKDNVSLTDMIVKIGCKMGMTVLAEGVETQEQYDYLARNSCHKIQGYLISKPMPQQEVIRFYEEWK